MCAQLVPAEGGGVVVGGVALIARVAALAGMHTAQVRTQADEAAEGDEAGTDVDAFTDDVSERLVLAQTGPDLKGVTAEGADARLFALSPSALPLLLLGADAVPGEGRGGCFSSRAPFSRAAAAMEPHDVRPAACRHPRRPAADVLVEQREAGEGQRAVLALEACGNTTTGRGRLREGRQL